MHKTCAFLFNVSQVAPLSRGRKDASPTFEALFRDCYGSFCGEDNWSGPQLACLEKGRRIICRPLSSGETEPLEDEAELCRQFRAGGFDAVRAAAMELVRGDAQIALSGEKGISWAGADKGLSSMYRVTSRALATYLKRAADQLNKELKGAKLKQPVNHYRRDTASAMYTCLASCEILPFSTHLVTPYEYPCFDVRLFSHRPQRRGVLFLDIHV